jgi:hypothetical protein
VIVPSCFEGVFGAILLIFLCVDVVDMLMRWCVDGTVLC